MAKCNTNQDLYFINYSYPLQIVDMQNSNQMALKTTTTYKLVSKWYSCLEHISLKRFQDFINNHLTRGINLKCIKDFLSSNSCILAKQHFNIFSKQSKYMV